MSGEVADLRLDVEDAFLRVEQEGQISYPAIATANVTAEASQRVRYDASGGTFQIDAPASPVAGNRFGIKEVVGDVTAVTISGNGNNIENLATGDFVASFSLAQAKVGAEWEFDGTQWITAKHTHLEENITDLVHRIVATNGSIWFTAGGAGAPAGDNANLFWDDANNRLGLGTASPSARLTIVEDHVGASIAGISITGHRSDGPPRPVVTFFAGRGIPAAPADVVTDDGLGELIGQGYAGGAFRTVASITMNVDPGTISATSLPSGIRFRTTPDGSIIRQERMRVTSEGNVGIGTTDPTSRLSVQMGTSTGLSQFIGVADSQFTDVGNVGLGEDTLQTFTLPANALNADGKAIRIRATFKTANNANVKTIRLHFGATVVAQSGAAAIDDRVIYFDVIVARTGASAQRTTAFRVEGVDGASADNTHLVRKTPAEDTTAAIVIKGTGETTTDVNDDVIQESMLVEFLN